MRNKNKIETKTFERVTAAKEEQEETRRETDTEEGSGGTRRGAKPRWKSWFGSPTAVMDANPRTKRIKDLQEQIHAREFGLGDGKGAKKNGREEGRRGEEGGRSSVPNGFK